jgi:hypothetical protein
MVKNGVKKSQISPSAPLVSPKVSVCIEIKAISVHTRESVAQFSTVKFFDGVTVGRPVVSVQVLTVC